MKINIGDIFKGRNSGKLYEVIKINQASQEAFLKAEGESGLPPYTEASDWFKFSAIEKCFNFIKSKDQNNHPLTKIFV